MRTQFAAVLLISVCVLSGCAQQRAVTSISQPAISDPYLGTPAFKKAIADGLRGEVESLSEFATTEQAARLKSAKAGIPIPIRIPKYGTRPDSLRGYFVGAPVDYRIPTLVDGETVGEYVVGISDTGTPEPVEWDTGTRQTALYAKGTTAVIDALGEGAVIVYTGRPTMSVLGWSPKGEAAVFVSIEDTPVSVPEGKLLRDHEAVVQANRLWSP